MSQKIPNLVIARIFKEYPPDFRKKLMTIRSLILKVAKKSKQIGELEETVKWGEPSYLPKTKNTGTTVRIHWLESKPEQFGIYVNCQTTLIDDFKRKFPGVFKYEGTRAIIFREKDPLPIDELTECIEMALTYHLRKTK